LPVAIVPFRDKASGVRRISTISQSSMTFFPIDAREVDLLYSGGLATTANNKIGYVVNQTTVDYYEMTVAIAAQGVRMDLIQPFSVFADTDTVLLPEFVGGELAFLDRVIKSLGTVTPFEQSDDNAEKIEQNG